MWSGAVRQARLGIARQGPLRSVWDGCGRLGSPRRVELSLGGARQAWQIWSGLVLARSGEAGVVRKCAVCRVPAWQEWFGSVCLVSVGLGNVRHGAAGVVPLGEVMRGKVWYCMARSGRIGVLG